MIRITQYRKKCIGCGACAEAAAFRWRISRKDGKSILIGGNKKKEYYSIVIDNDELHENMVAAQNCPVHIIRIETL